MPCGASQRQENPLASAPSLEFSLRNAPRASWLQALAPLGSPQAGAPSGASAHLGDGCSSKFPKVPGLAT